MKENWINSFNDKWKKYRAVCDDNDRLKIAHSRRTFHLEMWSG